MIPVPRGLPARRQGGHRAAGPAPDFRVPWFRPSPSAPSPRVNGQPWRVLRSQGLARGARLGASAPSRTWRQSTPLPRPSSDRAPALTSPGLQTSGPSRCEPGPGGLFRGGPVAAVMRVDEFGAADRARMWEPVPPSLPVWHHLFPLGPRAACRLCPVARIILRAVLLGRASASESAALRFTGPVPPGRCRSEVRVTRADRVRALVGRGPASPVAACPAGGAVVWVTGPGRPKGRGVVHASAYPGPVDKASQRGPGRETSA